jgi:membrane-associated phospholipid phosphatase
MLDNIRKISFFYVIYAIFVIVTGYITFRYSKVDGHLLLNQFHYAIADIFFQWNTHIADGVSILIVALVILLAFNKKYGIALLSAHAFSAGTTQILKNFVFTNQMRPNAEFEYLNIFIYKVENITLNCCNSFPSGHSTSAWCLFFCLSVFYPKKSLQMTFGLLALITAFSRVYLSQHWVRDILAGSIIGIGFSVLAIYFCDKYLSNETPLLQKKKS